MLTCPFVGRIEKNETTFLVLQQNRHKIVGGGRIVRVGTSILRTNALILLRNLRRSDVALETVGMILAIGKRQFLTLGIDTMFHVCGEASKPVIGRIAGVGSLA